MNAQTVQEEPSTAIALLDNVENSFSSFYELISFICVLGVIVTVIKLKN
jgi:hypothetical protein